MSRIVDPRIAEAIVRVREEKTRVIPGYDGVYGELVIFEEGGEKGKVKTERPKQRSIADFM
jgi:PHP family Zn ribbon phosphoesterase